jgi:hypothetical protein
LLTSLLLYCGFRIHFPNLLTVYFVLLNNPAVNIPLMLCDNAGLNIMSFNA